jgi:DNA segregation ATPase FtsK/SpoIIIE, S-DNA-T family
VSRYRRRFMYVDDRSVAGTIVGTVITVVAAIIGIVVRLLWRYRSALVPVWTALALVYVAGWLHATAPGWWAPIAAGTIAAAVLLATLAGLPRRVVYPWPWLYRTGERIYLAVLVAVGGQWLAAATAAGPATSPLPLLGVVGAFLGALPWWTHHRRREKVRVERILDSWPDIAQAAGIAGTRVVSAWVSVWGWTGRLALPRGRKVAQVVAAVPAIESGLGARPGSVRVEPDRAHADRAILRVMESDPHAHPLFYPHPDQPGTITRPILLGLFEDGTPVWVKLLRRNALVAGILGSGKSGILNVMLAELVACPDVALWGIDLKGGMELGPWRSCLARVATTPAQAVQLLADAITELDRRTEQQAQRGEREWHPTPTRPAVLVVVDEYAELPRQAAPLCDSLTRRGRAVAVNLLAATQRPTQKAMGNNAVRSQMEIRICLYLKERRDTNLVLGDGMYAAGWRPDALDAPGKFLISAPEHTIPRPARGYWMTDEDVTDAVTRWAPHRPTPPNGTDHPAAEDSDGADPTAILPPVQRLAEPSPEDKLWQALAGAGLDGVSIGDLIQASGKYRTWVYERLAEHARNGRAVQVRRGQWKATNTNTSDGDGG